MALTANQDWLYKQMSGMNVDLGSEEQFAQAMQDESNRQWVYEQAGKMGIDLGTPEQFASAMLPDVAEVQPIQQSPDRITNAFAQMSDPLYSGQYQYHQQVADKEAKMQREEQAQLPITERDRQLQEQIRQKEIEGKWGKPNGTTFGVDSQTGMPTITKTEGNGAHLYAGEQLANQDEIDALKGQLPSYLTREVKTPEDLLVNTAEAWSSNTEMGRDFKDMLDAGTITPEEYKQAMIDANQDYINQQTRILGQKATNATIADISKTINPIIEQLQAERREAMRRAAGQGQIRGGAYGAIGAQMSANTAYDSKKDAVLSEYLQAQQYLVDAIKISEAAQKGQGFWKGLGNSLGDVDTWDMGISQLVRSANLKKIIEKYEKQPDSLTDSERALMDAAVAYMSACAYNSDKLSRLYKAGQTTGESLPFMLQFAIMPIGAIKDKVAKGILGYGIEQFGGKALQTAGKYTFGRAAAETGVSLLGNMAAAGVQTGAFGGAKIAEGTISRMTGDIKPEFDENGRIVYGGRENQQGLGEALWNAGVDTYVENLSEMILTSGDPIKAFVRGTNLFKNLSKNEVVQVLAKMGDKWSGSTMGKIAGRMQFRNYPEEVAEEYVGNLLRWGMSTDVHSAAEAGLDADSQIDLWMGLAPTSIAFAGLGLGEYSVRGGIDRFQSSQAARKLRKIMLEGEERKYLDNLLKSRDSDEFKFAAHDVVKSILLNDKLSVQEKRAYLDNLYVTYQSQLALEAEDAKIADEVKTEVQGITNKNNGYVYPVSLAGDPDTQGHIVAGYVEIDETDPSKPRIGNDEIVTVKLNDGRVVQLNTKELDLTGTPQMAQEVFNARAEERINTQRIIDQSKGTFHEGDMLLSNQIMNPETGEMETYSSRVVSVSDEGVEVEVIDPTGQVSTTIIPHDVALQTLTVVNTQPAQAAEAPSAEQQTTGVQQAQPQAQTANMPVFVNGDENISVVDNQDGTYTNPATGEVVTREQMADKGYAFIAPQPAPAAPQVQSQQAGSNTANISETNPNDGVTKIEPNIFTASADDYVRATVENKYKGNKVKAQANIAAKLNGAKTELQAAQREFEKFKNKGITSKMNSDQWDEQYDQYERQIKGLTDLVSRLEAANIAAAHYQTVAEQQAEAERKAHAAAIREQRRQTQAAQLANSAPAERWNATPKVTGNAVTRTLPDGTVIRGHYVLTEAQAATPSHDPFNGWNTSNGFPTTEDGRNINDRDYLNDKDAQQITMQIAQTYDGQAVSQVPVVSSEGIVYDGNGRTIAGHIAAANNTDAAYIHALAENAANFGFTPEQVASMQHPRVYMQTDEDLPYNTTTFAKFNAQEKKSQGSTNRAVSNSKKLTESARDGLLRILDNYATLDTFFASEVGANDVIKSLLENNIITQQEVAGLIENTDKGFVLSTEGKNYITDLLIGALFDEQTIRMLGNDKGLKQSILRALPSIVENRRLGDYALTENINTAIKLLYEARQAGLAYKLYVRQGSITDGYVKDRYSAFDMLLAEEMSSGVETFRQVLNLYNNSARDEANNQEGLFEPRTPEDIKNEIVEYYGREEQPAESAEPAESGSGDTQTESPISSAPASSGKEGVVLQSLREQAQAYSEKLGVPIVVFNGLDEIPESETEARKRFEEIGNDVDAWYSPAAGTVFVNGNSPEILSEGGLQRKVFHEIVAHKGLRSLMGEQNFNLLCDYVWEAMSVDQRQQYYGYAYTNYNTRNEIELRRIAADEFMAFTAEQYTSLDTNDQSENAQEVRTVWQKITDFIKNILDKILGGDYVSDDLLAELYKASFENLKRISITDREIGGALVDRLGDMGLNVSTDLQANRDALKAAKADKSEAGAIHYYKTPSGQQYGFSYKGKVYLDPTKINAELPLHEYGHLWSEALRRLNPENWQRVVETIKADKDAWEFVKSLRPELTDENEIAEEVIATFSGKNGAEKMRAEYERMHGKDADYKSKWGNIFQNISKAIQDFWKAVGDFLNIKYESAEQVYDQVLKDFVDNMNPWKRVSDYLQARDKEYVQAAESGDIKKATNLFYDALKENIGNGITPYMSVGTYTQLKRLAKGVKTRNEGVIKEAAAKIAPLIPDNAVLIPAPSHDGRATDMLDLAKAVAEFTGSEVADVLRSAPRESQYQAKKATGVPMASGQLGITMEGTLPDGKTPIIIDNVVDSGNTAEACVQAVGRAVVVTIGDSAEQYRHAASLKSAAPVLRDKAGKVIPLSKRFEPKGSRYLGRRMYLSSNDPRFAISGTQVIPVTDKTLVGLHNISAEKLRKALKAGGLANPSAAVIDIARQNHHGYGEMSLVLPSRMIENADGTYAGDAYTPMYPPVEYRQGKQTEKRIRALVKGLPDNLADGIYYRVGEYMDGNRNSSGLEYLFLKNKGEEMPILTNKRRYPDISIEEICKRIGIEKAEFWSSDTYHAYEQLPADQFFEFNLWLEKYGNEVQIQRVKDRIAIMREEGQDKAADMLTERYSTPMYFADFDSIGYRILRDERDAGQENIGETLDAAARKIDELGLRNEFEDWKQQTIDSFGYNEVLFAGWTRDGDRRYVANTVENASRLMNAKDETNWREGTGVSETKSMLMDKMQTLEDIRQQKAILEDDEEKIKAAYEEVSHDWTSLGIDFRDYTTNEDKTAYGLDDNPFTAIDTALARLQEAMFKRDPIAFLNREYRYSLPADSEFGTRLKEMVKRIKNLPSRYFETKFRRPVYLNEFAAAVVPNDLSQDLRAGLESAGLRLFSYDPNAQGSRRDATLEATAGEGIRFSINGRGASTGSSKRSNRDIEALRQFESVRPEIAKEMESIKNNALNDGTFMKAPNGKPTNLDERQWLQVRTRAFKRWFGDWENDPENASKVLDENGEPMVVYHRTNNKFTQFDPDRAREQSGWPTADFGFYFSNVNERGHYGRKSMPVFLNIRNPREIDVDYYADFDYNYKHADPEEMRKDNDGLQINIGRLILDEKATKVFVAPNPNQIKSATNNNGDFSEENDDIRFSISNQNNDIFYSNAERAVEGIKQEKATPEQWRAMIEKAGGLKAGENKWIGLSDWLAQQRPTVELQPNETRSQYIVRLGEATKRFTLTKQQVLDYIRNNKIQIEEQEYGEYEDDVLFLERKDEFKRYYDEAVEAGAEDPNETAWDRMIEEYGDDFSLGYYAMGDELMRDNDSDYAQWEADSEGRPRAINETRLRYTTWGLENKREIALVVPTIESWNQGDEIHFGDAGEGRAIAWVRFGDAHKIKYGENGEELADVLVIDEIQSKRHQEGREKGYRDKDFVPATMMLSSEALQQFTKLSEEATAKRQEFMKQMRDKYNVDSVRFEEVQTKMSAEEVAELDRLSAAEDEAHNVYLNYRRAYDEERSRESERAAGVPAAPFEKNWHELAMKRILRFAAENGYDKVAWTTGEQQAKRYDIGKEIDHIVKTDENTYEVYPTSGLMMTLEFDENGMYADEYDREYNGKSMSDIFGKDLAKRLKEMPVDETLQGDGLRVGYDGMKGFYDDILPRFMQKYGKKWGVQVGEVTMPDLEEGYQTMHAIDINDAMRESVMEGQPMFSISGRGVNGTIKPQDGETRSQYIARVAETVKNMTPRNTTIDDAIRFSITVNHNSPYLLKKADGSFVDPETGERLGFDLRFMGSGEGNQAHGYGSYFSVRDLRKYAKNAHSILYKGEDWRSFEDDIIRNALGWVYTVVDNNRRIGHNLTKDNLLRALKQEETRLTGYTDPAIVRHLKNLQNAEEWVKENLDDISIDNRHHYTVSIPDNDGTNYIEEREPMSDRVRKAIMDGLIADGYTMEDKDNGEFGWYEFNKGEFREDPDNQISLLKEDETYKDFIHDNFHGYDSKMIARVSKYLSDAGVVGIHYFGNLDGECYVIFNPDDAIITDHIRFSVTGSRGAANIDKMEGVTTRMDNLAAARQMEEDGKDAKTIRMATGWERGADGKWRYEIDDVQLNTDNVKANFRKLDRRGVTAPMVWYHNKFTDIIADSPERKQLLAAYPQLADLDIEFYDYPNKERGAYSSEKKKISVNRANVRSVDECRSVLLHEIQHAIQEAELFAKGTSKEQIQLTWKLNNEVHNKVDEYFDKMGFKEWFHEHIKDNATMEHLREVMRMFPNRDFNPHYIFVESLPRDKQMEAIDVLGDANDVIQENRDAIYGINRRGETMNADELYHNAAGEVESRNVQNRMNLTPEERRERLLAETEDVAREDQVVIMNAFGVANDSNEDDQIRFSVVTSRKKIAELEAGEKIKVYRAAQVIDGKLYPPMAAKQQGQLVKPIELGRWEQAEEHPELAKDGKFKLDKANGSSVVPAAYNPYFHTSRSPLNDQFSSAYDRPNLVTLEVEVPASELTSGYKAEGAKDAVGETSWHSGAVSGKLAKAGEPRKVILSRWDKPLRIVPDAEVAEKIAGMLAGKDIAIPYNVVTPSLRAELEKQGVTISDQPSGTVKKPKEEIRFSVNNPSTLSRSETVTKALVQQANNNYNIMQSALKKVTADLKGIRAAMRMQSDYDRKVVDALLNLYNTLLQENGVWAQYMPDTTRRIATQIVHAIGKQNITEEVNTIMDHMVHAQAKAAQRQWDKLRQTPIDKINISGVVMQGKVALEGQHALKAMNDALQANMTIEQIEEQINQLMDMEDNATDESLKTQYKGQWIGLTIAAQHLERLQHLQEERQQLDLELQSARSNKALKPAARQQLVENIKQAMRDNYIEQAEAYTRSTQDLSEYVNTQEGRAKDFIRRQDANRDKIRSYAQRDLEGLATNPNRNRTRGNVARSIWDAFASPIRDLQSLLRLTGLHAPDGEGYLYNHFMRNWMDGADMERTGIVAASKTLDEKIAELTHGKYKTWEEAARKINDASHNMFTITMLNGVDGKDMPVTEEIPLNAGNALYIYAVNKMNDGRMKLNGMNITEEDVQALADKVREQFGQEILDVVDWVQSEFFSQLRNRYNPTHEALFGAPMDAIENYFPLRINANARQQNEDLSEPDTDAARLLAGTSTGAIKRRTRNSLPLDVRNADFFQEVIRHISQMERWNAFAQWNRDANILFSDINFRNRIKGMKGTIYGEGDKLYNYMKDAFRVAIGTYKPKTDTFSEITLNMAKGVTSAKINFRVFTALKQIASFPAFFTYMQDGVFVQSYLRNWLKPHETMKWAKENLPNFEKRVSKRDMGDMRLMQRSTDWQWNKRILELSSKYGMYFNVLFDTLTCATGARAVYDSHLADYMKKGYSEEDARNRARQDAEQAFNTSQQSSEGAFMSAVQQDRNLVTAALTVFRTSPIQYTRNFMYHTRNLLRKFGEGKRDEQIAFRMGQYKNDGLNDEQARKAAEKDYNKSLRQDIVGFVVYGALLNILWRLAGQIPYLLLGDDDDKKKQILDDATSGGAWFSPFTGLLGGGIVESALDGNGSVADMFAPEMPFTQDIKRAGQYLSNDKYAEFASQALSVLMQSGTGFDPLTASDMVSRIVTTLDSEEELEAATQALRVSQALLSIPQSQYEQMLIDKVVSGDTDEDAALEDFVRYYKVHRAPLTFFLRNEENDIEAEENAAARFNMILKERDKLHNPEDYEE